MSVRLRTKRLWFRIPLLSLKLQIWRLLRGIGSLTFRQIVECRFTLKLVRDIEEHTVIIWKDPSNVIIRFTDIFLWKFESSLPRFFSNFVCGGHSRYFFNAKELSGKLYLAHCLNSQKFNFKIFSGKPVPAGIYLLKVSSGNSKTMWSLIKFTVKTSPSVKTSMTSTSFLCFYC